MSRRGPRIAEARVDDLSHDGRGVAHPEGKTVFVRDALPGERVRYRVTRRKRQFDEAELEAVLESSTERIEPGCPHFGTCGGCTLQHMAPRAQLAAKQAVAADNLERIGRVRPESWLEPVEGPVWGYRRRARLSVKYLRQKERVLVGFRERDGRFVADLDRCPILEPAVGERLWDMAALVNSLDARDAIPQIEVACGDEDSALVFRHMAPLNEADRGRLAAFGGAQGFQIWLQPGDPGSARPMDPGAPPLTYSLPGRDIRLSFLPVDFLQVNAAINAALVERVLEWLDPQPGETVLDLYCGLGNFTLPLARHCARVHGVEGEASLVDRARDNAAANGIDNAVFHVADLADVPERPAWLQETPDKLMLDPPRTGARFVLNRFARVKPKRIAYVSCHPGTMSRDAGYLVNELGYRFTACGVADMFPQTAHVETFAIFDREDK